VRIEPSPDPLEAHHTLTEGPQVSRHRM
jgi:hypothetical protein